MFIVVFLGIFLLIFPVHVDVGKMIDPSLTMSKWNPGFEEEIIRPGDMIEFCFNPSNSSYHLSSLDGRWHAYLVEFVPANKSLGTGEIEDSVSYPL